MKNKISLPSVLILYGPTGSGKNTQAELIKKTMPEYDILDYGSELRKFVKQNSNSNGENGLRAKRISGSIDSGEIISIEDLMYVVEEKVKSILHQSKKVLMIGPGRQIEDVIWLSKYLKNNSITSCILHLHLTLEDIVDRLSTRYSVESIEQVFSSYKEALEHCKVGELPVRRSDDADFKTIAKRYRNQYKNQFSTILFHFQLLALSDVFILDASLSIEEVFGNCKSILRTYYATDNL